MPYDEKDFSIYQNSFNIVASKLEGSPGFLQSMGQFDGSASDLESLGYAISEGLIQNDDLTSRAFCYVFYEVLKNEFDFCSSPATGKLVLSSEKYSVTVDVEHLVDSRGDNSLHAVFDDEYNRIRSLIAAKKASRKFKN